MVRTYLSKSSQATTVRIDEARLALNKDPDVEIVEYSGGAYSNQELLNSDIAILVLSEDSHKSKEAYVGKGQYEQVKAAMAAKIPVYVIIKQKEGDEENDNMDIYFREVQSYQENGGDWKKSFGLLHLTGPVYNMDWNSDSLPSAVMHRNPNRVSYTQSRAGKTYKFDGSGANAEILDERGPMPDFDRKPRLLLCSTRVLS